MAHWSVNRVSTQTDIHVTALEMLPVMLMTEIKLCQTIFKKSTEFLSDREHKKITWSGDVGGLSVCLSGSQSAPNTERHPTY